MKRLIIVATLLALAAPAAVAGDDSTFATVATHYEAIRDALTRDSLDGVADHARSIVRAARALDAEFTAARAGIAPSRADQVRPLLPTIAEAAEHLAGARELPAAREAFYLVTRPLVLYHDAVEGDRPVVAYCPMEKKSWLQPDEPIGNPYAPQMLRCGRVVGR